MSCATPFSTSNLISIDPIVIANDDDFAGQGWSGAGTPESPFVIENASIISDMNCISVTNVTKHFVIRNCYLWRKDRKSQIEDTAILLRNSANGTIDDNVIEGHEFGVLIRNSNEIRILNSTISGYSGLGYNGQIGVLMEHSSNCIVESSFFSSWNNAVILNFCNESSIANSIIAGNEDGFYVYGSHKNQIINNTIVQNSGTGMYLSWSTINRISGNRIGMNGQQAFDYTGPNLWDDNLSLGNAWSDYDGNGTYIIPGGANSVDRHPWQPSDFNYTIRDRIGPVVNHAVHITTTTTGPNIRWVWRFSAEVTDVSGVDTVLAFFELHGHPSNYAELNLTDFPDIFPDQYLGEIDVPDPYNGTIEFYYWANDSFGNTRASDVLWRDWYAPPPPSSPDLITLAVAAMILSGIILAVAIVMFRKSR
jgi:parallel beta-helix repeat protein